MFSLEFFVFVYCLYFLINFYTIFMQIDYINKAKELEPVILSPSRYFVGANYSIKKHKIELISLFVDFILFFVWIRWGLNILESFVFDMNEPYKTIFFVDLFIIINWLISLPFDIYKTFKLDKEFNFSNITKKLYIADTIKSGVLFLIFGNIVIYLLFLIIKNIELWWIWGFVFLFGIIILINLLYPIIRAKMFDKFVPLEEVDKDLFDKIISLMGKVGLKSSGIFTVDASKRDNRLNAYFGGLGSTKRVVLFDTLIDKLTHNELLAVLGHELGHFKNKDIIKNIFIMGGILFIFFAIFGNLNDNLFLNLQILNEPYSLIVLFMLFTPAISFFLMPIVSLISRYNEFEADKFGSELISKKDLANALKKLANENKSFPHSHKLYIFFYYSHPPLVERLKKLENKLE